LRQSRFYEFTAITFRINRKLISLLGFPNHRQWSSVCVCSVFCSGKVNELDWLYNDKFTLNFNDKNYFITSTLIRYKYICKQTFCSAWNIHVFLLSHRDRYKTPSFEPQEISSLLYTDEILKLILPNNYLSKKRWEP